MNTIRSRARAIFFAALLASAPSAAAAQAASDHAGNVADTTTHARLFTRADPYLIGGFIAGAALMRPLDESIASAIRSPSAQNNRTAANAAKVFNFLGDPGTLVAGVAMYGVGRIGHFDRVADLGLHSTEALAVSAGITYVLKGIAGRQRPRDAGVHDADDFQLGGGFGSGGNSSFPSGHATAAFAMATVVTLETHRWWPKSTWYIAPVMYGGATLVGVARLYTNAHWSSDVIMGAGIGTITGLKVFRYNHVTSKNNRIDRWLLSATPTVSPSMSGRGVLLGWSFAAPR